MARKGCERGNSRNTIPGMRFTPQKFLVEKQSRQKPLNEKFCAISGTVLFAPDMTPLASFLDFVSGKRVQLWTEMPVQKKHAIKSFWSQKLFLKSAFFGTGIHT